MLILLLHHVAIMLILIPINKGWNMQNATTTLSALARQTAAIEAFTAALRDMDKLDALTALETAINAIDADREADITLELTAAADTIGAAHRSEEHTSELQSLMRISYAVFCLKN